MGDDFREFSPIVLRVEPLVEGYVSQGVAESRLQASDVVDADAPIVDADGKNGIVMHESDRVLEDEDTVAELDRVGSLAAHDQLGVRFVDAEDPSGVGNLLSVDDASPSQVAGVLAGRQEMGQIGDRADDGDVVERLSIHQRQVVRLGGAGKQPARQFQQFAVRPPQAIAIVCPFLRATEAMVRTSRSICLSRCRC